MVGRAPRGVRLSPLGGSGRFEGQTQRSEAATRDVVPDVRSRLGIRVQPQARQLPDHPVDRHLCLQASEWRPEAKVMAEAKAQVTRRRSLDPESVGIVEPSWVAAPGPEGLANEIAGP